MQLRISILVTLAVITTCLIIVPKTTLSQSVVAEKAILDYKIDTGIRLHPGLVRKLTHGQIEKDIVQWVMDNFDTVGAATGQNIANAALTANGNYLQNWAGYNLRFTVLDTVEFSQMKRLFINDTGGIIMTTLGYNLSIGSSTKSITLNRNTGQVMIDSAYYLPTTAGAGLGYVLQTTGTYTTAWNVISNIGLITSYNGSGTAGNGLWVIRSHGSFKNRSTGITVTTFIPPVDGEYYISGYFSASSNTGDTYYYLDYTDQNSVAQTGIKLGLLSTTGVMNDINCFEIQAKGGSAITLYTTISTGSITYDVSGTITQIDN